MKHGDFNMIESKLQILQWKQPTAPRPNKVRMSTSQIKTLPITSLHIKGTVHFEFIPQGQTVNRTYHMEILKRLREAMPRKGPELWPNDWILHQDSASAHKALSVKQFRAQNSITEMERPLVPLIWLRMTSGCFQK
jgi:hypothetical protein